MPRDGLLSKLKPTGFVKAGSLLSMPPQTKHLVNPIEHLMDASTSDDEGTAMAGLALFSGLDQDEGPGMAGLPLLPGLDLDTHLYQNAKNVAESLEGERQCGQADKFESVFKVEESGQSVDSDTHLAMDKLESVFELQGAKAYRFELLTGHRVRPVQNIWNTTGEDTTEPLVVESATVEPLIIDGATGGDTSEPLFIDGATGGDTSEPLIIDGATGGDTSEPLFIDGTTSGDTSEPLIIDGTTGGDTSNPLVIGGATGADTFEAQHGNMAEPVFIRNDAQSEGERRNACGEGAKPKKATGAGVVRREDDVERPDNKLPGTVKYVIQQLDGPPHIYTIKQASSLQQSHSVSHSRPIDTVYSVDQNSASSRLLGSLCATCGCMHPAMSDKVAEKPLTSTEVFDIQTNQWSAGPALPDNFIFTGLIKYRGTLCVIGNVGK